LQSTIISEKIEAACSSLIMESVYRMLSFSKEPFPEVATR
jgi:hypothetical protein